MDQSLIAEKADGKCETSHLDKGETNETINVNDSNDSERETSNKISEAKEVSTRPEEVNEKGEELKREEQENETGSQEHLEERVKDMSELGDIRSLDIAMAIAAGEILEFEKFNGSEDNENVTFDELDEDFEQKKKMIEEELRQIEEQYKAVQDETTEVISPAESYEELTERLLKVAESIQDSAKRLGNDDIDLTPRIDRIQNLRDECHLSNQSLAAKENINEDRGTDFDCKADVAPTSEPNECDNIEHQSTDLDKKKVNTPLLEVENKGVTMRKTKVEDLGQFQPAKMDSKFKNIFENTDSEKEVETRRQPKKKLITLDQVLIKSASQDMKHGKEAELEIIKTLRKNWVPPEETIADVAQTKLEPKKLQIAHVYGNDSRDGPEKFKQLRQSELEEIRQSAPLAVRWQTEETGDTNKEGNRSRPRSAMKVTQSDDFWLKLKSDEKVEEEKLKISREIESIKQARMKFEDEPEERQEDDARLKTLQELESLRINQKQTDNSVKKIKRDLEEINRTIAEKENKDRYVIDFQSPTEQWKREREKIKETFSLKQNNVEEINPIMTKEPKLNKIVFKEEATLRGVEEFNNETSNELSKPKNSTVDVKTDPESRVESHTSVEDRAKTKLKELKNLEIFKLKEKTLKLTQKIETERGRRRELKKIETERGRRRE